MKPRGRLKGPWWTDDSSDTYWATVNKLVRSLERKLGPWLPGCDPEAGEVRCPACKRWLQFSRSATAPEYTLRCPQMGCISGTGLVRVRRASKKG
jgi:ssDNA-binding Zn-finger/Zn-ribbon topoisomerase 1